MEALVVKICSRCKLSLPKSCFGLNRAKADGVTAYCKACTRARANAKYANNEEYREAKRAKTARHNRTVRQDPKVGDQHRLASKLWQSNNPGYGREAQARKKAYLKQRVPGWSEKKEIAKFYRSCPVGHEVDHIVPLIGDRYGVCGLHVLANLQYLTVKQNSEKSNKWCWEKQK